MSHPDHSLLARIPGALSLGALLILTACGGGDGGSDSGSGSASGNQAPSADDLSLTVGRGVVTIISPSGSDPEDDTLTYRILRDPTHGVARLLDDGTFEYYSANGYFGADSFSYLADDGSAISDTATVALTVERRLDPDFQLISGAWLPGEFRNTDYLGLSASGDGRWVVFSAFVPHFLPGFETFRTELYLLDRDSGEISRVAEAMAGGPSDGESGEGVISGDGRWIAFLSEASDLVPGDDEDEIDVFLLDRETDTILRITEAADGTGGDGRSYDVAIDQDGRFVAFASRATNLVAGDSNGQRDIFVYEIATGEIRRASVDSAGVESDFLSGEPAIASRDGSAVVVFESLARNLVASDTNGNYDVFVHDFSTGTTELVSVNESGIQGDDISRAPSISADGMRVAFMSGATNLVTDDTNGLTDVFVRDLGAGSVTRLSIASDGSEGDGSSSGPHISADGEAVVFRSRATTFDDDADGGWPDLYRNEVDSPDAITMVSLGAGGVDNEVEPSEAVFLGSNAEVAFIATSSSQPFVPGVPIWSERLFVRDLAAAGSDLLIPMQPWAFGILRNFSDKGDISDDGRYVIHITDFAGQAPGDDDQSMDIILLDRETGVPRLIDTGDITVYESAISDDGSVIAFTTVDADLVGGDTNDAIDVFVYEVATGTIERVSVGPSGLEADGQSRNPVLSADGRYVAFQSLASNLVTADTGGLFNVFLHDRETDTTELISVGFDGNPVTSGLSINPAISEDGSVVAFDSTASLIIFADSNGQRDIFVRDRIAGTTVRASERSGVVLDGESREPDLSADGTRVVFESSATNLLDVGLTGAREIFVRDLTTNTTTLVSVEMGGQSRDGKTDPAISDDGNLIVFESSSTDLVTGDTNDNSDIFLRDLALGTTRRLSIGPADEELSARSTDPVIAGDGSVVLFRTQPAAVLPEIPDTFTTLDALVLRTVEMLITN